MSALIVVLASNSIVRAQRRAQRPSKPISQLNGPSPRRALTIAAAVILAVLIIVLVGACSAISSGTVTKKIDHPAYVYTSMTYCGKGCYMPMVHYIPERFELDLTAPDPKHPGKALTGWINVDKHTYDHTKVGDYVESK